MGSEQRIALVESVALKLRRGRRRRAIREDRGLTQRDIESVCRPVLLRLERGENVKEESIRLVADELQVDAATYFDPPEA